MHLSQQGLLVFLLGPVVLGTKWDPGVPRVLVGKAMWHDVCVCVCVCLLQLSVSYCVGTNGLARVPAVLFLSEVHACVYLSLRGKYVRS